MKSPDSAAVTPTLHERIVSSPASLPWLLLAVTLPLYVADQVTKGLIRAYIPYESGIVVIPNFFNLIFVTNTGAAFSMFSNNNAAFIGLSILALVVLGVLWKLRFFAVSGWSRAGFALLTSGVLGNLTDRILHGAVIDFLQFDLHVPGANPWPSFNIADSCICIAAGCFLIGSLSELRRPPVAKPS